MNYKDLISESGFLTPKGEELFDKELLPGINKALDTMETEIELRVMGGILFKHVGDIIANKLAERAEKQKFFNDMNDDEFEDYLTNKYGKDYVLSASLTKEEILRYAPVLVNKMKAALEHGLEKIKIQTHSGVIIKK